MRGIIGKLLGDTCEGDGGRGGRQGARGTAGGVRSGWGGHAATTERCLAASKAVLSLYGRADPVGFPKEGETQSATTGGVRERGSVARGWVVAVGRWAVGVAGGWSGLSRSDLLSSALLSRSAEPTPPPRYANRRRPRGRPTDQRLGASHVAGATEICQPSLPRIADPTN